MAKAQKLVVSVIGLGYWGPNLLRNFVEHSDFEVRWACDLRPVRLEAMRQRYPFIRTTSLAEDVFND